VPSVAQQTESDFSFVVLCDETTDPGYVDEIRRSAAEVPSLQVVPTSFERRVRIPHAIETLIAPETELLITTRLDTDDALHREHIAVTQDYIDSFLRSDEDLLVLNFPRGFKYEESSGRAFAVNWMHSPFMSMFERLRPGRGLPANVSLSHHKQHLMRPMHFDESIAAWLQVIHGLAESTEEQSGVALTGGNWGSTVNREDVEVDAARIGPEFGVSLAVGA
jgi:hypothetical protein